MGRRKIKGRGKPYIYQNRIYFGKRPQQVKVSFQQF